MRDIVINQVYLTKRPVLALRLSKYWPITFDFLSYFPERLNFNTKFIQPIVHAFSLGSDPTKSRFKKANIQRKTAASIVGQFPNAYIAHITPEMMSPLFAFVALVRHK